MREIKFRAWDKERKRWTNCSIADDSLRFYDKHTGCWKTDMESDRFILCQYTGLTDKNGMEIYEGGIVRSFGNDYTPVYTIGIYMALNVDQLRHPEEDRIFSTQFNVVWRNGCEIVGNIYEHRHVNL